MNRKARDDMAVNVDLIRVSACAQLKGICDLPYGNWLKWRFYVISICEGYAKRCADFFKVFLRTEFRTGDKACNNIRATSFEKFQDKLSSNAIANSCETVTHQLRISLFFCFFQ